MEWNDTPLQAVVAHDHHLGVLVFFRHLGCCNRCVVLLFEHLGVDYALLAERAGNVVVAEV